jgi:sugar lactone lactonase YvrE
MAYVTKILLQEGIEWGEGPRWHEGKLYFSDIYGKKVVSVDLDGKAEIAAEVPNMPSGLGFLPDGRLLLVSGIDGVLYTKELNTDKPIAPYCAIKNVLEGASGINDMVVDKNGNAYVGTYGYKIAEYKGGPAHGFITLVTPDGSKKIAGEDIMCPNGIVIAPDGKTLIAADTFGKCLVGYDIQDDGTLAGRRIWAPLQHGPDGIAIDEESAVWAAIPDTNEVIRVKEGGEVTDRVKMINTPLSCALGGPQRKTLFIVSVSAHGNTSDTEALSDPSKAQNKKAYVEYTEVKVSGAGCP